MKPTVSRLECTARTQNHERPEAALAVFVGDQHVSLRDEHEDVGSAAVDGLDKLAARRVGRRRSQQSAETPVEIGPVLCEGTVLENLPVLADGDGSLE